MLSQTESQKQKMKISSLFTSGRRKQITLSLPSLPLEHKHFQKQWASFCPLPSESDIYFICNRSSKQFKFVLSTFNFNMQALELEFLAVKQLSKVCSLLLLWLKHIRAQTKSCHWIYTGSSFFLFNTRYLFQNLKCDLTFFFDNLFATFSIWEVKIGKIMSFPTINAYTQINQKQMITHIKSEQKPVL